MAEAVVKFGQTLLDITLEQYGTAEAAFSLLVANRLNVGNVLQENRVLSLPDVPTANAQKLAATTLQGKGVASREINPASDGFTYTFNFEL